MTPKDTVRFGKNATRQQSMIKTQTGNHRGDNQSGHIYIYGHIYRDSPQPVCDGKVLQGLKREFVLEHSENKTSADKEAVFVLRLSDTFISSDSGLHTESFSELQFSY